MYPSMDSPGHKLATRHWASNLKVRKKPNSKGLRCPRFVLCDLPPGGIFAPAGFLKCSAKSTISYLLAPTRKCAENAKFVTNYGGIDVAKEYGLASPHVSI